MCAKHLANLTFFALRKEEDRDVPQGAKHHRFDVSLQYGGQCRINDFLTDYSVTMAVEFVKLTHPYTIVQQYSQRISSAERVPIDSWLTDSMLWKPTASEGNIVRCYYGSYGFYPTYERTLTVEARHVGFLVQPSDDFSFIIGDRVTGLTFIIDKEFL